MRQGRSTRRRWHAQKIRSGSCLDTVTRRVLTDQGASILSVMTDSPELQPHERMRALLPSARAETCQVIATFLDIRGFSTFSAKGDSFDIATYLSSVYSTILTSYFPDTTFFKPTGDGLLMIHSLPTDRTDIPNAVSSVLARCVSLVGAFGQLTSDDYMINFPVPQLLGAGVARGTATRLVSSGLVLDYSGRCLNLAARLMDKARPYGVVFADDRAEMLIDPELMTNLHAERVCIRGIAEEVPIRVYVTAGVEITDADREPLTRSGRIWGDAQTLSLAQIRDTSSYGFYLPRAPHSYESAMVYVEYPTFDKQGRQAHTVSSLELPGRIAEDPNGTVIYVALKRVRDALGNAPETSTTSFIGFTRTKKTSVTFIPFLELAQDAKKSR